MTHDPAWMRSTGRILSGLLQIEEDQLAGFVDERLGKLDPARAADARAILVRIGEALREPTPERLMSLEHARRVLDEWTAAGGPAKPERAHGPVVVVPAPAPAAPPPGLRGDTPHPGVRMPIADSGKPSPWTGAAQPPAARPIDTTGAMSRVAVEAAVLPFGGAPRTAMPSAVANPDAPQSGETEDIDLEKLMASPPVPFGGAAAPLPAPEPAQAPAGPAPLTLEQYAHFCVERSIWPNHRAAICAKYGLPPAGEEAVHQHYRVALAANAELKARFDELQVVAQRQLSGR